ncbi:MAG: FAD-dependent oxidoreductase [Deltaproteobacteria bacterium]|nr:FAD-dependent oxidoreductase [Deltaproteobacteria bacterium]
MSALVDWVFDDLEQHGRVLGIPGELFFRPAPGDPFARHVFGRRIETPFGVAAGPHSQMAQNIVAAWLCGARFIELKTVQTLDRLEIAKPCIDAQDEGYNVEWSQELRVAESFDEYLRAWLLVHALHAALGLHGAGPGIVFNLSVGYDLAGIRQDNVRWFLERAADAGELFDAHLEQIARRFPAVRDLDIPRRISDSVTLSTMHGCPPDEIGRISEHLIDDWGMHTSVKLNPTLLGPSRVREILRALGFTRVTVPDEAFEHDLRWEDAQPLLEGLRGTATRRGVVFGVKLTNTLEVANHRTVFRDETMYLSGRPLHALTVSLAETIARRFDAEIPMSFAGGADAFNAAHLLRCGMSTVTSCTDLLKSGGYLRLRQYVDNTRSALDALGARSLDDLVRESARRDEWPADERGRSLPSPPVRPGRDVRESLLANLEGYSRMVLADREYHEDTFQRSRSKTRRSLGLFDCIDAPCMDECNIRQKVPRYMELVRTGRLDEAVATTREDNALAAVLGRACDHRCERTCVRTHYDEPLAIRRIKRFIMEHEGPLSSPAPVPVPRATVAIVGAGPCGLSAAYFLARAGYQTTLYEERPESGGQVSGTIPAYRLPVAPIEQDRRFLRSLGVRIEHGRRIGGDLAVPDLLSRYRFAVVATGAQQGVRLGLEGEDASGVIDGLSFLRAVRAGESRGPQRAQLAGVQSRGPQRQLPALGESVVVVGGGDVAMDCARSARRMAWGRVIVAYRRSRDEMPAQREEVVDLLAEGCELVELVAPIALDVASGRLRGVRFERMRLGAPDASGRCRPEPTGETFDLEASSLLCAIGQRTDLSLFGDAGVRVDGAGYVVVDPATRETSLPGVFAGGDVVGESPLSIVKAMGDGKRIAFEIRRRVEGWAPPDEPARVVDGVDLLRRRGERIRRRPAPHRPGPEKLGFAEVAEGYSADDARAEAARCLDCDVLCSLCVGVCPNLAFFTYQNAASSRALALLDRKDDTWVQSGTEPFEVVEGHQVAVLTDLCNECGNCGTFCPTAGLPYRDKPRLYLDRADFEAERDNAFRLRPDRILGRFAGETHELEMAADVVYRSPDLEAHLEEGTLRLLSVKALRSASVGRLSLRPAAILYALHEGIRRTPIPVVDRG